MSNVLGDLGIDCSVLHDGYEAQQYIPVVPGRVAHMDGDFFAYQVSYDEERTWDTIKHNLDITIETFRLLCGAEHAELHLTGSGGTKGGRYEQAMLKPYQEQRKEKPKPSRLEDVRLYMKEHYGAHYWMDREADDGMAMAQTAALDRGEGNLSVIVSKDKDLRIVQGIHLDFDSMTLHTVHGYGELYLEQGSALKLKGWGPAFFWAQMLMGDPADNISGLPLVHAPRLNHICPTAATEKQAAKARLGDEKAQAQLLARKPKQCGPRMAYDLLNGVSSDIEAWRLVADLYREHGQAKGFVNYRTGESITWQDACASEARLLWMRTDAAADPDDWRNWRTTKGKACRD